MIKGFKKFILRGSVIDMAVGVVMGSAVTAVVTTIVNYIINPLIAMIFGKPELNGVLTISMNGATISFGAEIGADLLQNEHEKTEEEKRKEREEKTIQLLQDIRDELVKR